MVTVLRATSSEILDRLHSFDISKEANTHGVDGATKPNSVGMEYYYLGKAADENCAVIRSQQRLNCP